MCSNASIELSLLGLLAKIKVDSAAYYQQSDSREVITSFVDASCLMPIK